MNVAFLTLGSPGSSTGKESACNARDPGFDSWVQKICWRRGWLPPPVFLGFLGGSAGKESTCNVGDLGLMPGRREWLPIPVFWPGEYRGPYRTWGHKELDTTYFHFSYFHQNSLILQSFGYTIIVLVFIFILKKGEHLFKRLSNCIPFFLWTVSYICFSLG